MNCKDAQFQIDERLRKGSTELPYEVANHIGSCPVCSAYLAESGELRSILDRFDPRVRPGELDDITFESIAALAGGKVERPGAIRARRFDLRWLWAPAAVVVAIVLVALVPKLTTNIPSTDTMNTAARLTNVELIDDIAHSDSLVGEVLADMADDMNMDNIAEELVEGADINDLLHGLSQSEMEALSNKIDELPGMGSSGKG